MFDYHAANDETIIARSHDGDDAATDFLLEKYKPLVKKKARTLFLICLLYTSDAADEL